MEMKKILIIGCSGSGKSYFAKRLSDKLGIKLFYMDQLFWRSDKTHITRDELREKLANEVYGLDSFILDGNYSGTLEERINHSDTVFYFDLDLDFCISEIRRRKGTIREDLPWQEDDKSTEELVEFVKNNSSTDRLLIYSLIEKYPNVNFIVFKSRDESNNYLSQL